MSIFDPSFQQNDKKLKPAVRSVTKAKGKKSKQGSWR